MNESIIYVSVGIVSFLNSIFLVHVICQEHGFNFFLQYHGRTFSLLLYGTDFNSAEEKFV